MLKGTFPFFSMGIYSTTMSFKGDQMCYLVDECNQKSVFVQRCVDSNHMQSIRHSSVIPMAGNPVVHDLQMDAICFDEFKTGFYGPIRQIFLKGVVHRDKVSCFVGNSTYGKAYGVLLLTCNNLPL